MGETLKVTGSYIDYIDRSNILLLNCHIEYIGFDGSPTILYILKGEEGIRGGGLPHDHVLITVNILFF